MMNMDLLKGEQVRLVAVDPQAFGKAMNRWSRDSEYWRLMDGAPARLFSAKTIESWVNQELESDSSDFYFFMIRTLQGDRLIGELGLDGLQWNHGDTYVGISLDGMEEINDRFRGVSGAFRSALEGIKNSQAAGIKVGLRFTINKFNVNEIPKIFQLLEERDIPRVCFYHLVYAGRGTELVKEDLSHEGSRAAVDLIIDETRRLFDKGKPKEVLTVDNHADGPYIYLRLLKENPERAKDVLELLKWNEGNNSGRGIGCVSWDGEVYADQFWRHYSFGNVKNRPFSQIWTDTSETLMGKLKEKKKYMKGRCATCSWLDICGGNFRVRAEAVSGDIWAPDPACYLTDEEIALTHTPIHCD